MKKIIFPLILSVLYIAALSAQPLNRSTPDAMRKAAGEAEAANNPYAALEFYEKVYKDTKEKSMAAKIALLNYEMRDYENAERQISRLVLRDRKNEFVELKYYYAMSLKYNGKYAEAIDAFKQYISEGSDEGLKAASKREIEGCEIARKAKQAENFIINNGGKKINSPQTEASPSYNNGELYFASIKAKEVITLNGKEGDWYSKIYTSAKSGPEFGDPTPLGTQINREGWHQGNVSITPDGRTMYFTRVQLESQAIKESKIYYAVKGADGWGAANEVTGVNGDYVAKHPCEGDLFGEKVLFFVANIPGGKGGDDIYYATKKTDGVFSTPVNLGDVINTTGTEATPFYRDGKLYFSSDGRPTIGGMDVFESQWNGSVWSAPKNMGLGVNSSVDDQYYTQASDGMSGFLVSNRPGGPNSLKSKTCCDDIYAWEIERIKVELAAKTFRFKRKGEKENQPLTGCTVRVVDVSSQTNPNTIDTKTNATANDFGFTLLPDKSYLLISERSGYVPDTLKFNTTGIKRTTTLEKKATLRTVKKPNVVESDSIVVTRNEPIRLNNIYYKFDDDKILPESEDDLQFLVDLMNRYPDLKIELSSHTDAQGKDDYNQKLSQRRAISAKNWMVAKGIATDRITPVGYGEQQILNRCTNGVDCPDEEHQFNRRTEFKIIAGPTTITIEVKEKRPAPAQSKQQAPGNNNKPKPQNPGGKQSVKPLFFYEF